jgi:hypothetical protein
MRKKKLREEKKNCVQFEKKKKLENKKKIERKKTVYDLKKNSNNCV